MKKTLLVAGIAGLFAVASSSCTKNNAQTFPDNTVQYTVQVVSGANLGVGKTNSTEGLSGATVSVNQNGKVTSVTTDGSGLAAFKVLPGTVAVTASSSGFTTVNFVASIVVPQTNTAGTALPGTTISQSYSSTLATLFPLTGTGTATLTGEVFAVTDYTASPANQAIQAPPTGTHLNAYLDNAQLLKYVTDVSGNGAISSIAYEGTSLQASTAANGTYTLTLPAAGAQGLVIDVQADDFITNVIQSPTSTVRTVFNGPSFQVTTFSGKTIAHDLTY